MVLVLADDFSGAAEIAGIAWRKGLSAEIQITPHLLTDKDVVIIDCDTRSRSLENAEKILVEIIHGLSDYQYEWLYKKIDSVLRGHVISELELLMHSLMKKCALVMPANPTMQRRITDGHYFMNNIPLHETDFARDPEFPCWSSDVLKLLGNAVEFKVELLPVAHSPEAPGIFVGETRKFEDLKYWASLLNDSILPVGGADFFSSILDIRKMKVEHPPNKKNTSSYEKRLWVLGSTSDQSRNYEVVLEEKGIAICPLPCDRISKDGLNERCLQKWFNAVTDLFNKNREVAATIPLPLIKNKGISEVLADFTAGLVDRVFRQVKLQQILIEGGTTASRMIRKMGWEPLLPVFEFRLGAVLLEVQELPDFRLFVKPGSYPWPENI